MMNTARIDDELFSSFGHAHIVDALVAMTVMLRETNTIRVASDALPLPLLPPYYWAKSLATMDVMSGGRLIAGLCPGFGPDQFAAHAAPWAKRGSRAEEAVEIITRLWTEERVTHEGAFYRL